MDKMNKENPEDSKNPETPPAPETPAKPRKEKKEKKNKETQPDDMHLPVLVELTYSISVILLIFVGLAVTVVSVLTGASLLNIILRTSAAMLSMGSLVVLIFHQVSTGVLQASIVEQEEAQKAHSEESENHETPQNIETQDMVEA
jgi:hypothetical protein